LLVLWQSKCLCKVNLCYIFQCERRPPSEEEMKSLKDQVKKRKEDNEKKQKDKDKVEDEELMPQKEKEKEKEVVDLDDIA